MVIIFCLLIAITCVACGSEVAGKIWLMAVFGSVLTWVEVLCWIAYSSRNDKSSS